MVILKKLKKANYSEPKVYWPIALLDTFGKVLETVVTKHLSKIIKRSHLLPEY